MVILLCFHLSNGFNYCIRIGVLLRTYGRKFSYVWKFCCVRTEILPDMYVDFPARLPMLLRFLKLLYRYYD